MRRPATPQRSHFWSRLSRFGAVHVCPSEPESGVKGRSWTPPDADLQSWKAGWVHALTSSNLVSSARLTRADVDARCSITVLRTRRGLSLGPTSPAPDTYDGTCRRTPPDVGAPRRTTEPARRGPKPLKERVDPVRGGSSAFIEDVDADPDRTWNRWSTRRQPPLKTCAQIEH